MSDDALKIFGEQIDRLIRGESLSREETKDAFRQMLLDEQPEMHQGALLAALTAKGETPEEIAGAWEAIMEYDTNTVDLPPGPPAIDNCGAGMDPLKTFNISTAAAVAAAAGGARIARHGARAITSSCGTVDAAEALGVDVECSVQTVAESVARVGVGLFNGMSAQVHPGGLFRILSQIRFGSALNTAASLANPARPRRALRGVSSPERLRPTAEAMRAIGYERALVVHGLDADGRPGMDEWSPVGETLVMELRPSGELLSYSLTPEDLGVARGPFDPLKPLGRAEAGAARLAAILAGERSGVEADAVVLNAGPLLWLAGRAADLREGAETARAILSSGRAYAKLEEWVAAQTSDPEAGLRRLAAVRRRLKTA